MKKVKWIRNGAGIGYSHFMGDTTQLSDKEAIRLRDLGMLVIVPDTIDAFEVKQPVANHFKNRVQCR